MGLLSGPRLIGLSDGEVLQRSLEKFWCRPESEQNVDCTGASSAVWLTEIPLKKSIQKI